MPGAAITETERSTATAVFDPVMEDLFYEAVREFLFALGSTLHCDASGPGRQQL
jgi:hypothetical protein